MGWPKKDSGLRLYFERKPKSYMLVDFSCVCPDGALGCIGEVLVDNDPDKPQLATSSCTRMYLYRHCRRVAWEDMPPVWQKALQEWIEGPLESHRGLRRMSVSKKRPMELCNGEA
jgi:hypothetical protein